jgi:hypothetical protein
MHLHYPYYDRQTHTHLTGEKMRLILREWNILFQFTVQEQNNKFPQLLSNDTKTCIFQSRGDGKNNLSFLTRSALIWTITCKVDLLIRESEYKNVSPFAGALHAAPWHACKFHSFKVRFSRNVIARNQLILLVVLFAFKNIDSSCTKSLTF